MTFLTFCSADLFYCYAVHFTVPDIFMELLVNAVEFISIAGFLVVEIHFAFPVAVDTPAHTEFRKLFYFPHFLYGAMAGLTILLPNFHMLTVIEINVVGQVVNFYPLDWFARFVIFLRIRVPPSINIQFLDFCCTIYFLSVIFYNFIALVFFYRHVTVHTNIYRRDIRIFTVLCAAVAI